MLALVGVGVSVVFFVVSMHRNAKAAPVVSQLVEQPPPAPPKPEVAPSAPEVHALPKEDRARIEPPSPPPSDDLTNDDDSGVGSTSSPEARLTTLPPEEQRRVDDFILEMEQQAVKLVELAHGERR